MIFFSSIAFLLYILPSKKKIQPISRKQCNIRRKNRIQSEYMWNVGNFIDLGANNGDSLVWFYNLHMPFLKYFVPYPKLESNITKNFNTFIFEANPYLCDKISKTVDFIKQHTELVNFKIFCPVIVSTYEGVEKMTIDVNDYASSKYYESNYNSNRNRKVVMVKVLNFTNFLSENIPPYDFNVMKFDVEGEEDYIIPELMKTNLLSKFDVLYSEFHLGDTNNPLKERAKYFFEDFLRYTNENGIETYEEEKISEEQKKHYTDIYKDLLSCK